MTDTLDASPPAPAWRQFPAEVARLHRLSRSFLRATLTGQDLDRFADNGYDQRFKLVFPLPGSGFRHLPSGPDWYARWRTLPMEWRNPFRTYTVRSVRQHAREIDVDLVLHGASADPAHHYVPGTKPSQDARPGPLLYHGHAGQHGPAARWAATARPGDPVVVLGPNQDHLGDHGGREFQQTGDAHAILLAGDETAVPAICAILERLPPSTQGEVLLEVPYPDDILPCVVPPLVSVSWLARSGRPHGSLLVSAVQSAAERLIPSMGQVASDELGTAGSSAPTDEKIWEVPAGPNHVWLAGEAELVRTLRRYLVGERGVARESVAFMGYWRLGRAAHD
ncbi:siderophore-interacting protein [Micromonospora sp. NPDC050397]|uniref:siderophore-interacting protein n=1 Tax=Micromonospora sp. NPDC050397 TaxID=3364279 RepID=UPI0038511CBD